MTMWLYKWQPYSNVNYSTFSEARDRQIEVPAMMTQRGNDIIRHSLGYECQPFDSYLPTYLPTYIYVYRCAFIMSIIFNFHTQRYLHKIFI